ncbi:MAG: DUF512 domain-containing protein [Candidatus Wallbacteria bacterium]|nr:DUF512 domain-containing protein [Candidatus Wallbacteria bacterium]
MLQKPSAELSVELHREFLKGIGDNVLPVTSCCDSCCLFCSNNANPAGILLQYPGHLPMAYIMEHMEFLSADQPVVIGESATRICEGEPLCHPEFMDILTGLRQRFPKTSIRLTTSGSLIDERWLKFFASIGNLELTVSVNSLWHRLEICGNNFKMNPRRMVASLLSGSDELCVSFVYLQEFQESLLSDIVELMSDGVTRFRIFKPGFTRLSRRPFNWPDSDFTGTLESLGRNVSILLEPPEIHDIVPQVRAVLPGSPSAACGICRGDVIISVSGTPALSRYNAHHLIRKARNPVVVIRRNGDSVAAELIKSPDSSSGLVFDYDISDSDLNLCRAILHRGDRIATAPLPGRFLKKVFPVHSSQVCIVDNLFFGGNIQVAGLLVLNDLFGQLKEKGRYFLPQVMFDTSGRDLQGLLAPGWDRTIGQYYLDV